jgi:signal transduction histidine kinase
MSIIKINIIVFHVEWIGMSLEEIAAFLEANESEMVEQFKQNALVSDRDRFKDIIHLNGQALYRLIVGYFRSHVTLEQVKKLSYKVAQERIQADINISDFVHNVCLGRKIILERLQEASFPSPFLEAAVIKISECLDIFLEHAIARYMELKDNDLAEKQLFIERSHKDKLTILGQLASSFVHEFRNPLTSVIGFSKLLKEDYPDLRYVDIIVNELHQLNYRVSQFLLASKKGAVQKSPETFSIDQLFAEILSFLYPNIVDVNVEIQTNIDPDVTLTGYREEIKQVFINIISNALDVLQKKQGRKEIAIAAVQSDDSARIEISNNGAPIPGDLLPVIFEPFFTTKELGTGIGLYVCKEIIERHAGTIWCESTEQQTTFYMEFQRRPVGMFELP